MKFQREYSEKWNLFLNRKREIVKKENIFGETFKNNFRERNRDYFTELNKIYFEKWNVFQIERGKQ